MRRYSLILRAACLQAALGLLPGACGPGPEPERDDDVGGGQSGTDASGAFMCRAEGATFVRVVGLEEPILASSCTANDILAGLQRERAFGCTNGDAFTLQLEPTDVAHELAGVPYSGTERRDGTCPLLALEVTASFSGVTAELEPPLQLVTDSSCSPLLSGDADADLVGKVGPFTFVVVFSTPPSPQPLYVYLQPSDGSAVVFCTPA